jgi:hypothetical protein
MDNSLAISFDVCFSKSLLVFDVREDKETGLKEEDGLKKIFHTIKINRFVKG